MQLLEVPFVVHVPQVDERAEPDEIPAELPRRISKLKADRVAQSVRGGTVVAADTVVIHKGEIMGKPRDADDACAMLRRLRGDRHLVLTGLTVMEAASGKAITEVCESRVWLREMADAEIQDYVASGDPMDKAAAYAIQNRAFAPVARVDGCPANVMGLPMCHVVRNLRRLGHVLPPTKATECTIGYGYVCALRSYVEA
jgi:septum formation protein